jgi:hypothetical protein
VELEVGDLKPRAVEFTACELVVTLIDGRKIATPLQWYPRLQRASAAERENYELMPTGIHRPEIDEDLTIAGMLKGQRANNHRAGTFFVRPREAEDGGGGAAFPSPLGLKISTAHPARISLCSMLATLSRKSGGGCNVQPKQALSPGMHTALNGSRMRT